MTDLQPFENKHLLVIVGAGGALGTSLLVETLVAVAVTDPVPIEFTVGLLTSVPFAIGIVYLGFWVARSDIPTDQYPHLVTWLLTGAGLFLLINLSLIVALPPERQLLLVSWVRWAVSIGAGAGLFVGICRAQAVVSARWVEQLERQRDQLAEQTERLDEFASIVSHDLRSPLSVAQGRVELARADSDRHSEDLEAAAGAMDRMMDLIDDLLLLAREGQADREFDDVGLGTFVTECWATTATGGATLENELAATIEADRQQLRRVFENLFRNAVEHGSTGSQPSADDAVEHGGSSVTVTVGALTEGFYVADDGPGIPDDERDSVFDAGYSTGDAGNGLGLSIVKRAVEAHGWEIRVTESQAGGARFEITGVGFESR